MHRLLKRQLKKVGYVDDTTPLDNNQLKQLLELVDASYRDTDDDRNLLERSLEVSSAEMKELYQELKEHSENKLRRMEHKYQRLKDNLKSHYFFYRYGTDSAFTSVSESIRNILGYTSQDFMSGFESYLTDNPINRQVSLNKKEVLNGNTQPPYEMEILHKNGYPVTLEVVEVPIRNNGGEVIEVDGIARDITLNKRAKAELLDQKERLEFMAHHDTLTGLPNRLNLYKYLNRLIYDAKKRGNKFAVIFIDLDYFKHINDSLGHEVGDELLKQVAECLKENIRFSDLIARLGGDEFVLVFNGIDDDDKLLVFIEKIQGLFNKNWQVAEHTLKVTCSIGVAIYPEDAKDLKGLLTNADIAMYNSKGSGRNTFSFFTVQLDNKMHYEMRLSHEMPNAIKRGDFELFYQPVVSLESENIIGSEALIRWNHPEQGIIAPAEFIGLAESTGFILELGDWIIDEAGKALFNLKQIGCDDVYVSINISTRQFQNSDIYSLLKKTIEKYAVRAELLHIEITESLMMEFVDSNIEKLRQIKSLGVSICIDNFGTGYSSISRLQNFPVDTLKIDRSFIALIEKNRSKVTLLNTVLAMANELELQAVAEGVEHKYQRNYLLQKACLQYQGFLFSRPVEFDRLVEQLEMKGDISVALRANA